MQRVRQDVADAIKRYILDNRLRPGDPLPTESTLRAELGASRSSIREAIKTLGALDIVDVRHGHGTYVGALGLGALVESLAFRGLLGGDEELRVFSDLVDVRELLERGSAAQLVCSLSTEDLAELSALAEEMARIGSADAAAFAAADRAFHARLTAPLGNGLIGQLSTAFWEVYALVAPQLTTLGTADEARTIADHREIAASARARDPSRLAAALTAHYAPVRARIAVAR